MIQESRAGGLMPSSAEKGADISGNVARPRPTSTSSNLRPLLPRWSPAAYSEHLAASRALLGGTVAWHARSSSINSGRGQEISVLRGSAIHVEYRWLVCFFGAEFAKLRDSFLLSSVEVS